MKYYCDRETDLVYVSKLLVHRYPVFYQQLAKSLRTNGISVELLPYARDVWIRDFMPLQVSISRFVQYEFKPRYLVRTRESRRYISDPIIICNKLSLETTKTSVVLDGGNIVRYGSIGICTERILEDNPGHDKKLLLNELCSLLSLEKIVVVPQDQLDRFGHIDSMVRFHDEKAVLVNEYPDEHDWHFNKLIVKTLRNAGIDVTPIPAVVFRKHETLSARGCYMNFLQVANLIALPIFECSYDSIAVKRFETIFNRDKVIPIVAKSIAEQGGVINCVTWNIRKNSSHRRKI